MVWLSARFPELTAPLWWYLVSVCYTIWSCMQWIYTREFDFMKYFRLLWYDGKLLAYFAVTKFQEIFELQCSWTTCKAGLKFCLSGCLWFIFGVKMYVYQTRASWQFCFCSKVLCPQLSAVVTRYHITMNHCFTAVRATYLSWLMCYVRRSVILFIVLLFVFDVLNL